GEIHTVGVTPDPEQLQPLADHLCASMVDGVYVSHELARELPPAEALMPTAAGALAVGIDAEGGLVAWLRPELVRTVRWGGNPNEPAERHPDGQIGPRRSFGLWREQVRGQARRFSDS